MKEIFVNYKIETSDLPIPSILCWPLDHMVFPFIFVFRESGYRNAPNPQFTILLYMPKIVLIK